jgi:hypothetical protein
MSTSVTGAAEMPAAVVESAIVMTQAFKSLKKRTKPCKLCLNELLGIVVQVLCSRAACVNDVIDQAAVGHLWSEQPGPRVKLEVRLQLQDEVPMAAQLMPAAFSLMLGIILALAPAAQQAGCVSVQLEEPLSKVRSHLAVKVIVSGQPCSAEGTSYPCCACGYAAIQFSAHHNCLAGAMYASQPAQIHIWKLNCSCLGCRPLQQLYNTNCLVCEHVLS